MRVFIILAFIISILVFGTFWRMSFLAQHSRGLSQRAERFEVKPGENVWALSVRLKDSRIIASRLAFLWEIAREGKAKKLVAGVYELSGNLAIPEIIYLVTEGQVIPRDIRVTFPEGWDMQKMSERLTANNLPGKEFLDLAKQPDPKWRKQFDFLSDLPAGASLQGFLFPDTYFFDKDASAATIVEKMLTNFGEKARNEIRATVESKNRDLRAAVILASIVENEVKSENDRRMVSDIFLRRLASDMPLQSDATLKFIRGDDKVQYSFEETRVLSPYNTYLNTGLPPEPIGNPGLISIRAAVFPQSNNYLYFLSDPRTGETVFSVTYEEHLRNKKLHGL